MKNFNLATKQILGIDYGRKKIGLALADESLGLAFPYKVIENKGLKFVISCLKEICRKEKVIKIIIGMPYSLGIESEITDFKKDDWFSEVKKFVKLLEEQFKLPVIIEDERLSTKIIQSLQKSFKAKIDAPEDAVSAAVILQNYLDKSI